MPSGLQRLVVRLSANEAFATLTATTETRQQPIRSSSGSDRDVLPSDSVRLAYSSLEIVELLYDDTGDEELDAETVFLHKLRQLLEEFET